MNSWCVQVTLISMEDSNGLHEAITENGMNASGFYGHDMSKIVKGLSEYHFQT